MLPMCALAGARRARAYAKALGLKTWLQELVLRPFRSQKWTWCSGVPRWLKRYALPHAPVSTVERYLGAGWQSLEPKVLAEVVKACILERECGIVGGKLTMGTKDRRQLVRSFQINHLNIIASVGNSVDTKETQGKHVQNATDDFKTMEDMQNYVKHFKPLYCKLYNRNTISRYGTNVRKILTSSARCGPLVFGIDPNAEGLIDLNKAYTTLLAHDIKTLPVFDVFDGT